MFPDRYQIVGKNQHKKIKYQFKSEVVPLLCVPTAFFFFSFYFSIFAFFTLFLVCFYFLNIFLLSRSTQKGSSQNFTANGCKLWSTKNLDDVMKNKNSTSGSRSLSSKGNFGILIFAQPVSPTHGWMQNLILPDFKKKTLF